MSLSYQLAPTVSVGVFGTAIPQVRNLVRFRPKNLRLGIGLRYTGKVVEPCLHLGDDLLAPRRNLILEPFARSNCAGLPLLESRCENLPPRSG